MTAPCRVVAQMVNHRFHAVDSGFDPARVPPAFFRQSSGSITGPCGTIRRPEGVRLLGYEVDLGLVIGAAMPVGTKVTEANLVDYVAGLAVANDELRLTLEVNGEFGQARRRRHDRPPGRGPHPAVAFPGRAPR